jgi:outer membrane protein insertion porin family
MGKSRAKGSLKLALSFRIITLLILILLPSTQSFADQVKVAEIIVAGNRRIESPAISNAIKLKVGDNFYEEKIDEDIKSIYNLGFFTDVKAEKSTSEKGVVVTYIVSEKPVVREILFDGNSALTTDKLKENLDIKPNSIFSAKELVKSIKKLKKLYVDEGYPLVEIEPVKEQISPEELKITLKISGENKILIREIKFEGNKEFDDSKLKSSIETKQDWWLAWLTGAGVYKEDAFKNDMMIITELYMNNGYINFKIAEPKVEITTDKKALNVLVSMTEGDKFSTGQIDFRGDLLESKEELNNRLKMKSGEVFSRGALRQEVFALTDLYADKGYAFANVNPVTTINSSKKLIDISFDFEKGEKVFIDRINISGNSKTRDKVLRREMRITEGEMYSATGIKKSKQNLMNLGFFEEATIATSKGKEDNKLNLDVSVKEKATGTFSIGGGYSSLDGFVGQGSIQQTNLFGYGLKSNASVSIGGKSSTYSVGLTDPYFLDTKWSLGGDLYRTERQYVDYTKRATGADIKGGYQFSDTLSTFLLYRFEKVNILKESFALLETRRLFPDIVTTSDSTTSAVTASISRNTTDYRLDPTTGMTNSLSVEFAGLGGTNRFIRYIGQTAQYFPVLFGSVFMLHGTVGHIMEMGVPVPIDEKFYLGGITTIRGYSGRTITPSIVLPQYDSLTGVRTGEQRAYIGGDTEVVFNAEYSVPLIKDAGLKGVIFFDTGNSVNGLGNAFSGLLSSYGMGIRWFSPIGPLRLEYGIPLNPRQGIDAKNGKLEFSIGNFF